MVMEAQPSPQSVGREFVRQYYTLLNKAPNHLHRFYNNNSSFIHGESTLVVGQKNIHNRIQQLNFRDCHAKISQVDAQATLGNGVVVQVTGELSNDGQPMRRFTQTFVLAAQSPKKFYVHNDIFRYQDLYADEENDGETRSENEEERESDPIASNNSMVVSVGVDNSTQQVLQQPQAVVVPQQSQSLAGQQQHPTLGPQQQQQTIYYSMPQNVVSAAPRPVPVIAAQTVPLAQFNAASAASIQAAQLNGVVGHEDILSGIPQGQPSVVAASIVPVVAASPQVIPAQPQPASVSVSVVAVGPPQSSAVPAGIPSIPVQTAGIHSSPAANQHQQLQQQQQQQQGTAMGAATIQQQLSGHPQTSAPLDDEKVNNAIECNNVSSQQQHTVAKTDQSPTIDDFKAINEQQQQEKYEAAAAAKQFSTNEPKTYANLFKSNNTSSTSSGNFVALPPVQNQMAATQHQNQHGHQQKQQSQPQQQQSQQQSSTNTYTSSVAYIKNDSSRIENNIQQNNTGGLPQRNNSTRINKDFDQRRTSNSSSQQYSDSHQLFLGNVPHHATEEELRALFSRFGHVIDLRIHSKTLAKVQGLRPPQNYGFITYDNPESVMNCLSNCPLYFPENSPDGQQLNVEEKKPRMRNLNDMAPRQNNMSGSNIGGNSMGGNTQRGSLSGGPNRSLSNSGMMRGGGSGGNSLSRGSTGGGPRMSSGFNRNENRGPPGTGTGGPQSRNGNSSNNPTGGNSYGSRR